jgi:fermentation-respiration switch protein FrsA (DUF1100 family)
MKGYNAEPYKSFDKEEITQFLFNPRPDNSFSSNGIILQIPVDENVKVGALLHHAGEKYPFILFFHGNGEIASDYNDLAPLFTRKNINFMVVDYRGYGTSTGKPSASSMIHDAHKIFAYTKKLKEEKKYTGNLIVMGRSLGSASALELGSNYGDEIDALIIESGFANIIPLLKLLGINTDAISLKEDKAFMHSKKITTCLMPTLIIHAEKDHIIPYSDGKILYEKSASKNKKMLTIPRADHNTIFMYGMDDYMNAVGKLIKSLE